MQNFFKNIISVVETYLWGNKDILLGRQKISKIFKYCHVSILLVTVLMRLKWGLMATFLTPNAPKAPLTVPGTDYTAPNWFKPVQIF